MLAVMMIVIIMIIMIVLPIRQDASARGGQRADVIDDSHLVVEAQRTRRLRARRVTDSLEIARVPLLGVVLTNRRYPIPEMLYRLL